MLLSFTCDKCGRRYRVDEKQAGKQAKCKDCGSLMRVPAVPTKVEESPAGTPILRHQDRERDFELAIGDSENIQLISDHIEEHVGPISQVFHELISDLVHIDVHEVPPTDERPFWTLVTSGMSDRPMTVPEGAEELQYAELAICLPPDWKLSKDDFEDEANYWPIRLLKVLARLPHEYSTWLGVGHTVPNGGEEPTPYASNTRFCCALLLPPFVCLPSEFAELEIDDDKTIHFLVVWPLYEDEMTLKLNQGLDALIDRFQKHRVTEVIEVLRPNSCARRPWWKFW